MPDDPTADSEEFIKFKTAMMQIVSVEKTDIVDELPKMFRERKPPKNTAKKRKQKL
jgi:hypothetical protein